MILPKAKTENMVVQDLGDELLIYNVTTHQAYTLNETSKIVFNSCDGPSNFDDLKRAFKFTDDLIHLTLDKLAANDLLEDYHDSHFAGLPRREVIKRIGFASVIALPVIFNLAVPTAAYAASVSCAGVICNDNNACTTDSCVPGTGCVYTPISCYDGNACTTDTCNPATGCQYIAITCPAGQTCNPATGCA